MEKTIQDYYDFSKVRTGDLYFGYPANARWNEVISQKAKNTFFEETWVPFESAIGDKLGRKIVGTTFHAEPSYSGYFLLEEFRMKDFLRIKKIHFFLSLLGPYYTILGVDESYVTVSERSYQSLNLITISPSGEYADTFNLTDKLITTTFNAFRFVPYFILAQNIGMSSMDSFTVFEALFHNSILKNFDRAEVYGSKVFGGERWLKSPNDIGHWTAGPPDDL
ncbi:hypothetical protein DCC81_12440 [Chitinophaga parva]|uniref:Uncharacterized protein n=1 Tax=Chitinophaga parva TaxID=2169414 RepID=A0A2T7BFP8_9BACT|nr:hypothetical protein DCC81_12440 [Chitinophaga parva]